MLKFLRQYNKFLLAGFGSILLLTWLVPSAVTEFSRRSGATNATWATLGDGQTVTMGELQQLQRQMKVLDAMGVPVLSQLGGQRDAGLWYLLVREARQAGLVGGISDGQRVLAGMGNGIKPEQALPRLCAASGLQPQAVLETLAELQGVARLLSIANSAARLSDVRLEVKAAEAMTGVAADLVVLSAAQPLPQNDPAPTPDRMQAMLKEFATVEPGKGRNGFGYRQPDRFAMEWFAVPASAVRASLANDPRVSGVALRKAFLKNPSAYGATAGDANPNFDDFREKVLNTELDRLTAERMEEISKSIADQTQLATRNLPKDGVYAKLPADGAGVPALDSVMQSLSQQFGLSGIRMEKTSLIAPTDLSKIPGLGTASTNRFGTQPMQITELVEQAKEFKPKDVRAVVQSGVVAPPLRGAGAAGGAPADLYAFRITETVPAHDAANADEVRAQLMEDAAKAMRFETMEADRAAIETQAKAGLDSLASAWGTKVEFAPGIRETDANLLKYGLKVPTPLPVIGADGELSKEIVKRAMAMPADLANVSDADRTFLVAAPDKMALVAVKVREVFPVSREDYLDAAGNPRFRAAIVGDGGAGDVTKAFNVEAIKARAGFKPTREEHAEDENAAPADKANG